MATVELNSPGEQDASADLTTAVPAELPPIFATAIRWSCLSLKTLGFVLLLNLILITLLALKTDVQGFRYVGF